MPITKYYELTCDKCGKIIKVYRHYKPSITEIRKEKIKMRINNGHIITYCEECITKKDKQ